MMITNTKIIKPKTIDNIENIIDGGESRFISIYNNLKNNLKEELVSKLISRLFTKLEKQRQQIEEYKQEITALKNNLVYLLKRILLSKNNEDNNLSNFKRMKNYDKLIKNYSLSTNNTTYTSLSPKNKSSSTINLFTNFYNKTELNKDYNLTFKNQVPLQLNQPQTELDIKVNNYIQSLYIKNSCKNETNLNNYYSLNKTQSVYNEVLENIRKKIHNLSFSTYNSNNNSKRNISSSMKKIYYDELNNKSKNKNKKNSELHINSFNYEDKNNSNINIDNSNYLKVTKKNSEKNFNKKNKSNNSKSSKSLSHISKERGNNKRYNINLKKKMNKSNHYIPLSRSPFLINKI